jgi:hypothetical protein
MGRAGPRAVISSDASGRTLPNGTTEARTRASPEPEDQLADGKPKLPQYALPDEYGPARAPRPVDDTIDPAVRTVPRDAPATGPSSQPTQPPPTPTRRERRELRQRKGSKRRTRSTRSRWIRRGIAIVVILLLIPVAWSYVHALQRPGTDSLGVRSVEWVRDHGGNGIVNTIERWWYTNNPPVVGGNPDQIRVQGTGGEVTSSTKVPTVTTLPQPVHLPPPTQRVKSPAPSVETNEGVWMPAGRLVGGLAPEYITFVRPDAIHTSYYVALMWLDTKLLKAVYVPGSQEPGGGQNPWGSQVPEAERNTLIAAFNSGFKMDSAHGGVYVAGEEVRPLVPGAASLVIKTDGSASVGAWGRDFTMTPDIASVRQNLALMIDNGQLDPALDENDTSKWGATLGNKALVWRSGVGVDANGALIYAGGPSLSVLSLARTLQAAGAVRAMELDINTDWVSAYTYVNDPATDPNAPVVGIKLGGDMSRGGDRYLQLGERDFFAFFADPKAPAVAVPSTTTTAPTTTTTPRK